MTRALSKTAAAHLARWDGTIAPARDAATVLVTRPAPRSAEGAGASGVEVLLLRRPPSMRFAAGMHVFPGGAVDRHDRTPLAWIGPTADAWAKRWRCDPELAGALVVAAVRETFEETGILLAGPDAHSVVTDLGVDDWAAARRELESGSLTFAQFLADHGLVLRADLLVAWGHWITPEFEPRRFDTRFFLAALPAGPAEVAHGPESDASFWIEPAAAVQAARSGELAMMAPTLTNLQDLRDVGPTATALERTITTVQPRLRYVDGQPVLTTQPDPAGG